MLNINTETDPKLVGLSDDKSIAILNHTLQSEGVEKCDIDIIFSGKDLLKNLKKEFFNKDHTTDVIAFRISEYEDKLIEGEIYICLPVAKENADFYNETYEKEIARLIIHGGLHLIGYDDGTKNDRDKMRKLEDKYLKELEI